MKKDRLFLYALIFLIPFAAGCASASKNLPHGLTARKPMDLLDYQKWSSESVEKLSIYLDKSKEELRLGMGNPARIQSDVISGRKHYDEIWFYHYSKGILFLTEQSWRYAFYINNNHVVNIEAY